MHSNNQKRKGKRHAAKHAKTTVMKYLVKLYKFAIWHMASELAVHTRYLGDKLDAFAWYGWWIVLSIKWQLDEQQSIFPGEHVARCVCRVSFNLFDSKSTQWQTSSKLTRNYLQWVKSGIQIHWFVNSLWCLVFCGYQKMSCIVGWSWPDSYDILPHLLCIDEATVIFMHMIIY